MTSSTRPFDLSALAQRLPLVPLALIVSCLFSLLVIVQNPLLNDDAYGYLRAAEVFNSEGARAVLESYGWYHYSILVALFDRVIPGTLVTAAHVFNTALYALLTYAFMLLARELRDTPRVRFFAAVCILVYPLTNEMRYFLIRDIGFWAFALLSLVYLIRFARSGDPRMAARWSVTLIVASAFRLEGLLLMALAPWSLLLPDGTLALQQRAERCGLLVGVLTALAAAVLVIALLLGLSLPELIAYAYRWYLPLLGDFSSLMGSTADSVGAALFTPDNYPGSSNTAINFAVTLFGYLLVLLANLINALSIPLALLLVASRVLYGAPQLPQPAARMVHCYIAIATLALLIFLFIMHFLTQRYAALLALLLLAYVPPVLDELYERAQQVNRLRHFHGYFFFFAFYFAVDSLLSFGYSHRHVEDAMAWTRNELPAGATLRTNSFAIAYASARVVDFDKTPREAAEVLASSNSGDYLVLEVGRNAPDDLLKSNPGLAEVKRFSNERGDEVRVYLQH